MCDFSLEAVKSRPAKAGDKLTSHIFNWGTKGFCAPEDQAMAVCLLPGTELSFAEDVWELPMPPWSPKVINYRTAVFRQVNKDRASAHHDAIEFPNGKIVLVTALRPGQQATVLQLPATHYHDERKKPLETKKDALAPLKRVAAALMLGRPSRAFARAGAGGTLAASASTNVSAAHGSGLMLHPPKEG